MTKPEWGIKRTCQECDTTFYDLKKDPITCPKCLTVYDEKALTRKQSVSYNTKETAEIDSIQEDDAYSDDDFFLETPSDLLESLEEIEDEYEGKTARTV